MARRPDALPGFCVVAIVREPLAIIRHFVDWYRRLGAARIRLYFDDPADPALAAMQGDPLVDALACTAEFWRSLELTPEDRFTLRQNAALTHAYHDCREDWLLVVDADELLHLTQGFLPRRLARIPRRTQSLRVLPAEHAHAPQESAVTTFRLPITRRAVNEIYGPLADLFRRRHGLIGHSNGKSLYRCGIDGLRIRQHWAILPDGSQLAAREMGPDSGLILLHYIAADYAAWRAKLEWRLASSGFTYESRDQLEVLLKASRDPETAYRQFYDLLHGLDPARKAQLQGVGGILELPTELAAPA